VSLGKKSSNRYCLTIQNSIYSTRYLLGSFIDMNMVDIVNYYILKKNFIFLRIQIAHKIFSLTIQHFFSKHSYFDELTVQKKKILEIIILEVIFQNITNLRLYFIRKTLYFTATRMRL